MKSEWQKAVITSSEIIAENIRRIELSPKFAVPVKPGEHLKIMVPLKTKQEKRSYSIVDAHHDGSTLALSVLKTRNSRGGSEFMHTLRPGDEVTVSRPSQDFPLRVGAPEYVLVAGGIGITAIRGMASLLKKLGANYRIHFAARSLDAMAYKDELVAEHGENLHLHLDSEGTTIDVPALINSLNPHTELYMCGPIRLMDAIRRAWNQRGLDPTNLRFETFGNSGWYLSESFQVNVPELGLHATVNKDESMLEALQKAGAAMMFDCRKGECGLCQVRILDVDGKVDHRDVFFSDRQKESDAKACACVSRVVSSPTSSPTSTITVALS
ncbi:vanillate O-demethylase oxygenase [Corynebacterium suranareeae]|uniref:Vanillate O-demethylase oxygenase n=1 Tax=Corynebacterium suranareeae TaxID=2506452 RepID=A0A160PR97_9CORY|nr:PDR/VanB family oxidoreductase [Corynebacterium suranareeae]BAU96717.1 vanillate O-demethylase oxygenase [Corynebacterium suranareeae]